MGNSTSQLNQCSKLTLLLGGFCLLLSVPFIASGYRMVELEQKFQVDGVTTSGIVTSKWYGEAKERDRGTTSVDRTSSHYIKYRFELPGAAQVTEGEDSIGGELWESLSVDSPVQIQYLQNEPFHSRLAQNSSWVPSIMFSLIGGIAALSGVLLISIYFRKRSFVENLMRNGMMIDGVIGKVYVTSLSINKVRQWRFDYTYKDLVGGQHTGRSGYISPQIASSFKAGQKGRVRYDQSQPQKSIWVGDGS